MGSIILIVIVLALVLSSARFGTGRRPRMRWSRRGRHEPDTGEAAGGKAGSAPRAATPPAPVVRVLPRAEDVERILTERVLDGTLSQNAYRDKMARLASIVDTDPEVSILGAVLAGRTEPPAEQGNDPRVSLGRLIAALPELPLPRLYTAFALVRCGASVDELVRLLDLTYSQAHTVVANL